MSIPVVYGKNCLGDVAKVFNTENVFYKISSQICPKSASTYLESVSWDQFFGGFLKLMLKSSFGAFEKKTENTKFLKTKQEILEK